MSAWAEVIATHRPVPTAAPELAALAEGRLAGVGWPVTAAADGVDARTADVPAGSGPLLLPPHPVSPVSASPVTSTHRPARPTAPACA